MSENRYSGPGRGSAARGLPVPGLAVGGTWWTKLSEPVKSALIGAAAVLSGVAAAGAVLVLAELGDPQPAREAPGSVTPAERLAPACAETLQGCPD